MISAYCHNGERTAKCIDDQRCTVMTLIPSWQPEIGTVACKYPIVTMVADSGQILQIAVCCLLFQKITQPQLLISYLSLAPGSTELVFIMHHGISR
jgi:hypothetical protein